MGCDIHAFIEARGPSGRWLYMTRSMIASRNYGKFAFLAGIRNYSGITPLSAPRGLPEDVSLHLLTMFEDDIDYHSLSYFTLEELLAVDYDKVIEDRRVTRQVGPNAFDGGCTCAVGEGELVVLREFLGEEFFKGLDEMKVFGRPEDVRLVFAFDN